jgi:hypothetical protein
MDLILCHVLSTDMGVHVFLSVKFHT